MKKLVHLFYFIILIALMICLVLFPDRYMPECFNGLKLWAIAVLPSLLPFFFLTTLMTLTCSLSKLSKLANPLTTRLYNTVGISAYVQLMSFISGYPVGAKIISELKEHNLISNDEATRMSCFCSTSGPLFIVGSVSIAMFENKKLGAILLLTHLLSSILTGIIFRFYGEKSAPSFIQPSQQRVDNALYESIYRSVISVIIVGGFVAIFYTLAQILSDFRILKIIEYPLKFLLGENSNAFCQGLIECTKGCKLLAKSPSINSVCLTSSLIAFGGLSVIFQSLIYLKQSKVNVKVFIASKFAQMFIAYFLTFVFLKIFTISF